MRTASYFSNEYLRQRVDSLPLEARNVLVTVFGRQHASMAGQCIADLSRLNANQVINELRDPDSEPSSYLKTIREACDLVSAPSRARHLIALNRIDHYPEYAVDIIDDYAVAIETLESSLISTIFAKAYQGLTNEQRAAFTENLKRIYPEGEKQIPKGLAATGAAMVLGNLGGFGTYMAMSSLLSTISFGTLSFGTYTAASSLLSIALGPVGWAFLGATAVGVLGRPDKNKVVQCAAAVALADLSIQRNKHAESKLTSGIKQHFRDQLECARLESEHAKESVRQRSNKQDWFTRIEESLNRLGKPANPAAAYLRLKLRSERGAQYLQEYSNGTRIGMDR